MSFQWLANRLALGGKRKKPTVREKARRNRLTRKIRFEHLESRALLSASFGSLHSVTAEVGKLTGPAIVSTHSSQPGGPPAPPSGNSGGRY